jgi:iron-sulfur cluster repair protein YtfE (RIC family)
MSKEDLGVPKYEFAVVPEGVINPISPIKKSIAKTYTLTETFNMYEVLQYIAKMERAIEDKQKEKEGLEQVLAAYKEELEIIEEQLGVQKLEEEYQKSVSEEIDRQAREKDETIVNEVEEETNEESVKSPYVKENI